MHLALTVESDNPLAAPSNQIHEYLVNNGKKSRNELLVEFWGRVDGDQLDKILNFLQTSEQVIP